MPRDQHKFNAMPLLKYIQRQKRKHRTKARMTGTTHRPRCVLFRSNKHVYAQLVDDATGKVLVSVSDLQLKERGRAASQHVGLDLAKKALKLGIQKAVFDRSGYAYHGKVQAVREGAKAAGLEL